MWTTTLHALKEGARFPQAQAGRHDILVASLHSATTVMPCWVPHWVRFYPRRMPLSYFQIGCVPRELEGQLPPAVWKEIAAMFNQWYAHEAETNAILFAFTAFALVAAGALVLSGTLIAGHELLRWGGAAICASTLPVVCSIATRWAVAPGTCVPRRWAAMCDYLNERHILHDERCRVQLVAHGMHMTAPALVFSRRVAPQQGARASSSQPPSR